MHSQASAQQLAPCSLFVPDADNGLELGDDAIHKRDREWQALPAFVFIKQNIWQQSGHSETGFAGWADDGRLGPAASRATVYQHDLHRAVPIAERCDSALPNDGQQRRAQWNAESQPSLRPVEWRQRSFSDLLQQP